MSVGGAPGVPSLTITALDAYVQRGTATTTQAESLASQLVALYGRHSVTPSRTRYSSSVALCASSRQ